MKRSDYLFIIFIAILLNISNIYAQELPPIENYTAEDYAAGNQNWMISQASNKFIYVANNEGLLEYNGADWKLYPSPNSTIIRAVKAFKDRVYTGSYMEFGYWIKDSYGIMKYVSLVPYLEEKMIDDEQFWNIITFENWVLFQSFDRIYFYNTEKNQFSLINSSNDIPKVFNIKGAIYYLIANDGLYKIEEGKSVLVSNDSFFKENIIINIFSDNGGLLIHTRNTGFFKFQEGIFSEWNRATNTFFKSIKSFTSLRQKDGNIVVGTISDGLICLNHEGNIQYIINQNNGLSNNTALSLFEDADGNVWVGLDNGINCINFKRTPVKIFRDEKGKLGTVYAISVFNGYLYLGTNQGLFSRKTDSTDSFELIDGTSGQVWALVVYNNELFCGHHAGTFLIDQNKALLISNKPGTWSIKEIPHKNNLLLQGNYTGLSVLVKEGGKWRFRNKIKGFDNSSKYFELFNGNEIFVNHEYKGVFRLVVDENMDSISAIYVQSELPIGKNSSIAKFKKNLLYASNQGVFKYSTQKKIFEKDSVLSSVFSKETYMSGRLIVDKSQKMWAFLKDNIKYVTINDITSDFQIKTISIPSKLIKGMIGYENISIIDNSKYLIGTTDGYIILNLALLNSSDEYSIFLNSVSLKRINSEEMPIMTDSGGVFKHNENSIKFKYSVPVYDKYQTVKYQYKLNGYYDYWSDWTNKTELVFDNLPFGEYQLQIRGQIGDTITDNISIFNFEILKPWYRTNLAIVIYAFILLSISMLTHKRYKMYYKRQIKRKQLENDRLIVHLKNEQLKKDIENKNRELAISTMSIINKNEVLNCIKKELKNNKISSNNNEVIRLIDGNLNNSKDWQFFEEAFNNADKFFIDRLKQLHPNLTPNDLRFCAYLRLNLTSKEIAPLLNISVRSVETKRYRLRKQMNLEHDEGLVAHILEI
jgi:ligand-binding sensor domain-containing protein/DNA-binding CsgD family transcriptional regulator